MRRVAIALAVTVSGLVGARPAAAHIELLSPEPRTLELKVAPCGLRVPRGSNVTNYAPGQTITVRWQETVPHPGHYRISFDADGDDDFVDPGSFTDINTVPSVMIDGIADRDGTGLYTQQLTLPNINCDRCTLQVIQVMTDKPPYGDGNDVYHQCADLIIGTPGDGGVPGADGGGGDGGEDGGCGCRVGVATGRGGAGAGPAGAGLLTLLGAGLLAVIVVRRRRARRS
ncbi:MAG: lytic polysaccharide monooxygenase [Deltaproteobacteria bacterium]|nr:lytic polysaccharide monooxygenase [Deltaproteobacteria bacterium]